MKPALVVGFKPPHDWSDQIRIAGNGRFLVAEAFNRTPYIIDGDINRDRMLSVANGIASQPVLKNKLNYLVLDDGWQKSPANSS